MALISDSPGPYAIFVTIPAHDKEGPNLFRIPANGLATDDCVAEFVTDFCCVWNVAHVSPDVI